MFTKRPASGEIIPFTSALQRLRRKRQSEAKSFRSGDEGSVWPELPGLTECCASPDVAAIKQEKVYPKASLAFVDPSGTSLHHSSQTISLLDTLPGFMALSAAQIAMQEGTITDVWMHLAAGYMVQAVAEQYLVFGCKRQEVLQEAFAWGFDSDCSAEEGSDEWHINAMFFGEDEVVNGWDQTRDEHMHAVGSINAPCLSFADALTFPADSAQRYQPARASRPAT